MEEKTKKNKIKNRERNKSDTEKQWKKKNVFFS